MTEYIIINSIKKNPSLCDGPGYRTVLFLQGCHFHCKGCHNMSSWDINNGTKVKIKDLAEEIRDTCENKELTISGGEPLDQKEALIELLKELSDFNLCLYTGFEENEVPEEVKKYLKFLKVGPYIEDERTFKKAYVGSKNQRLIEVAHDD